MCKPGLTTKRRFFSWSSTRKSRLPLTAAESPIEKKNKRKRVNFSCDGCARLMMMKKPLVVVPPLTTFHAKVLSFGLSASGVAWNRFCSLWLLKCGFSPRQVGAMKSLSLVGKLVAQPAWAGCADSGNPPFVLALSVALSMVALELLRLGTRSEYMHGMGEF